MKLKVLCDPECNAVEGVIEAVFVDGNNISKEIKAYFERRFGEGVYYDFTEMDNTIMYFADGYYTVYDGDGMLTYYLISIETEN